jgi:hypothetical protein
MAGFQVSINGRFWVSTEADAHKIPQRTLDSTTSRNNDVHARVPVNAGVDPGFAGYVTQF